MSLTCVEEFKSSLRAVLREADRIPLPDPNVTEMLALIQRMHDSVERPLRVVVLGGTNVGKTSLVNLLVGDRIGPTSAAANTRLPVLYRFSQRPGVDLIYSDGSRADARTPSSMVVGPEPRRPRSLEVGLPFDRLRIIEVVDTPGIDNPDLGADLDVASVRRSDLAIWVTDANQAWKESERRCWEPLACRNKKLSVLIVGRVDLLRSDADRAAVIARLNREAAAEFGTLLPLALPAALAAREDAVAARSETLWKDCGGGALEEVLAQAVLEHARSRIQRARAILERALRVKSILNLSFRILTAQLLVDVTAENGTAKRAGRILGDTAVPYRKQAAEVRSPERDALNI